MRTSIGLAILVWTSAVAAAAPDDQEFLARARMREARVRSAGAALLEVDVGTSLDELLRDGWTELVLPPFHDAGRADLYQRAGRVLKVSTSAGFGELERVDGLVLGAEFGGPRVLRAGFCWDRGEKFVFAEMERLFSGVAGTFTLKGVGHRCRQEVTGLTIDEGHLRAMAAAIRALLEAHVVPRDPDFMLAPGGRARWLDTGRWQFRHEPTAASWGGSDLAFRVHVGLVRTLLWAFPAQARRLAELLWRELEASTRIPESLRAEIRARWRRDFREDFGTDCRDALGEGEP